MANTSERRSEAPRTMRRRLLAHLATAAGAAESDCVERVDSCPRTRDTSNASCMTGRPPAAVTGRASKTLPKTVRPRPREAMIFAKPLIVIEFPSHGGKLGQDCIRKSEGSTTALKGIAVRKRTSRKLQNSNTKRTASHQGPETTS